MSGTRFNQSRDHGVGRHLRGSNWAKWRDTLDSNEGLEVEFSRTAEWRSMLETLRQAGTDRQVVTYTGRIVKGAVEAMAELVRAEMPGVKRPSTSAAWQRRSAGGGDRPPAHKALGTWVSAGSATGHAVGKVGYRRGTRIFHGHLFERGTIHQRPQRQFERAFVKFDKLTENAAQAEMIKFGRYLRRKAKTAAAAAAA